MEAAKATGSGVSVLPFAVVGSSEKGQEMIEFSVDPEFKALIPPLSSEELAQLEQNILAEGCRDALVVWQGLLLDGHNRFEICTRHGLPFKTVEIEIEDRTAARIWIRNNQTGRRNLTAAWRIELELGNKADLAAKGEEVRRATQGRPSNEKLLSQNDNSFKPEKHSTRNEIAKAAGVSVGQVAMAEQVIKKDPEKWEQAKNGEISISTAYKEINKKAHVANNSGDNEWYTPEPYVEAARNVMGSIDLDPATSEEANSVVSAETIYTAEDDGLVKDWAGKLWMNPPYDSSLVGKFIEKLALSVESGAVTEALVLVNNATETKWFSRLASVSSFFCFPTGRVKFWHPSKESTPLQGQAIAYIGHSGESFFNEFKKFGFVVEIVR